MSAPPPGALGRATRTAAQVAADLRRDFETAVHADGSEGLPDPVLAILFQTLGAQVGRVYQEAEQEFPVAVLEDLMEGLGMPPRLAQPAQTVVRFSGIEQREPVGPDTQLTGHARTGDLLGFAPDEEIELSPTTLAFAAVYEAGRLYAVSGARVPDGPAIPPESVPLELAAAPTLYLAFDVDDAHLGGLGLFVDGDGRVTGALGRSPWQLLDARGCVYEAGVLRAWPGRAGVRRLGWLREGPPAGGSGEAGRALALPPGPYGARVWVFPRIPAERRHRSGPPPALAEAAALLLPEEAAGALERPLAWVQVPLPAELHGVADAVQRIEANCVTASNLEVWSEYISFERMGSAFRVVPEGKPGAHVVGVLSVVGQRGDRYVEDDAVDAPPGAGRWRYRDRRVEVRAARHPTGQSDYHAVVRMLLSDGARGNDVDVGQVCRINASLANVTAQVTSLAVSREGKPPPAHADTKLRFAELLRTRERVVTAADVELAARAFEPRVAAVEVEGRAEPGPGGVARVVRVTARVHRADFAEPETELPRLCALLEEHLQARAVLGYQVRVSVEVAA